MPQPSYGLAAKTHRPLCNQTRCIMGHNIPELQVYLSAISVPIALLPSRLKTSTGLFDDKSGIDIKKRLQSTASRAKNCLSLPLRKTSCQPIFLNPRVTE